MIVVFGFQTFSRNSPFDVIYHGHDGVAAQEAVKNAKGYARAGKVVNPPLIPCQLSPAPAALEPDPIKLAKTTSKARKES